MSFYIWFYKDVSRWHISIGRVQETRLSVIHNACIGAGVDLITAADVRYCTEDSFFQVTEVDGVTADVGTYRDPLRGGADRPHARLLMHSGLYKPKHVRAQFVSSSATADGRRTPKEEGKQRPPNRAKPVINNNMSVVRELCFTARKFDAKEASQLGLVSKVFPDKDSALKNALEVAENIAAKSPVAVQITKESMVYSLNRTNKKGLEHIALINQAMLQSEDLVKSAMAQASKGEKPQFENF
ncbi:Delta(3,5)-Delta(2,4)-dienoyl-CoA isomerase, mitochondrial [Eumeta japonica]|uniref:Delta(3,5)-Delta(2,4)-dienoyl-CoA isomerase, mitochondrial n=1 Tax=Eumeta variegata TaxID=151549 RepID=A0A4C1T900_EUMVA|nr:Delta(3,5)-Delta(2,4)-dienoyl-CoA isomerase, mitochondrial [Eumeta japonica]